MLAKPMPIHCKTLKINQINQVKSNLTFYKSVKNIIFYGNSNSFYGFIKSICFIH